MSKKISAVLLSLFWLLASGTPAMAGGYVVQGRVSTKWYGLKGELNTDDPFDFSIRVQGREFVVDSSWLRQPTDSTLVQYIFGVRTNECYRLNKNRFGKVDVAALFPHSDFPEGSDALGKILWMAYLSHLGKPLEGNREFSIRPEEGRYRSEELEYDVTRSENPPHLPLVLRTKSPPYYYRTRKAAEVGERTPLEAPYAGGIPVWGFRASDWTNSASGSLPLKFEYRRFLEYQTNWLSSLSNSISVVTGSVTNLEIFQEETELLPKVTGTVRVFDFRFRNSLGLRDPIEYLGHDSFLKPVTDPVLANQARSEEMRLRNLRGKRQRGE